MYKYQFPIFSVLWTVVLFLFSWEALCLPIPPTLGRNTDQETSVENDCADTAEINVRR